MGWSRNLGTVTEGTIRIVAIDATTDVVPNLMTKTFDAKPQLSPEDIRGCEQAVAMAKEGLRALGVGGDSGAADVHIGGQVHALPDGSVQRSITATVTIIERKA